MVGGAKSLGKEGAGKGLGRGKRHSSWERWWREGCGGAVCEGCGEASCDGCSGSLSDGDNSCDTCRTQSECDTCVTSSGCDSDDLWICFKSNLNNHKAGRNFDGEKAVTKARVKKINSAKITNPMADKETMVSRKGETERSTRTDEPPDIVPTSSRGSSKKTKLNNQKAGQNFDGGKDVTRSMAKKINSAQITNHIAVEKEMTSIKGGTKRTIRTDEPPNIMSTSSRGSSKKPKLNNQKAGRRFDGEKAVTKARVKKINSAKITNHMAVKEKMASIKGGTKRIARTVMKGEHHENDRQAGIESM